jgi:hypothetical protein
MELRDLPSVDELARGLDDPLAVDADDVHAGLRRAPVLDAARDRRGGSRDHEHGEEDERALHHQQ